MSAKRIAYLLPLLVAVGFVVASSISQNRSAARCIQCTNNLKQISLAFQNYSSAWDSFPPAYSIDASGRPLHSWRVLLIPYLEKTHWYSLIDLDEPWDGPKNGPLLRGIKPLAYFCPNHPKAHELGLTSYVAVSGPETLFPGGGRTRTIADITDGTSKTIAIVETVSAAIPWMAPRDLDMMTMSAKVGDPTLPSVSSYDPPGAGFVRVDGTVGRVGPDIPKPGDLRHLLTIAAGDGEPAQDTP